MVDDRSAGISVDWSSASVDGGKLRVPYTDKPSAEWLEYLDHVFRRLGRAGSGWGAIKVTKKRLSVSAVTPGSESDLRHLVESAILQVNAMIESPDADDAGDERSEADQAMTDAFRAFAG